MITSCYSGQPPCCRYCGKQIEKEDFRTELSAKRTSPGQVAPTATGPIMRPTG